MRKTILTLALISAFWILPATASAESPNDILVIVNSSVKVKAISLSELKDLFLKKRTSVGTSGKVTPVHAKSPELRGDFRKLVLGMSPDEEKKYWNDRKIQTGDSEPVSFSDTLRATYKLRGAISYVYRSDFKEGVAKVVLEISAE